MASEQDAGRDKKITFSVILIGIGLIAALVYAVMAYTSKPDERPSQVNLDRVGGSILGKASETSAYREQLDQFNRKGAAQAQAENATYIASMRLEQQPIVPVEEKKPPANLKASNEMRQREQGVNSNESNDGRQDVKRQALDKFLTKLNPEVKEERITSLQTAKTLGGESSGSGQGGAADNGYQQWSQSLGADKRGLSASVSGTSSPSVKSASVVPIEVIPPYWRGPGYIDIGVDSDNSTTPVLGKIDTGTYAGAVLKASDGAKLTGDGVVIHFSEMAYKGINYKIDAYALQEDSLLANVATDVNHRYMSRIVLPALLGGIGGIGEMYSQANTQLVSNGFNSQVVRPSLPDGAAVLGAMAGGAAGQAAKVLTEDAQRVPATQVTVTKGQVVAIQFMRGVYSGDAVAPGQGGDDVKAAVQIRSSSQSSMQPTLQPTNDDQWRAAARQQIQAQQMRQELNR